MVAFDGFPPGPGSRSFLVGEVTRASADFVLDTVRISRGDGDLLEPLLFTAILEANLAIINRDRGLQLSFADLDHTAPDALRRPVSINSVAQSLCMPFETVRRRVQRLARAGACVIGPHGVYVPERAVTSPAYNALQVARHERLGVFYATLKQVGAVADPADPPPTAGRPPVRVTNRAISEYMLRVSNDLIGLTGDVLSSVVLLAMAHENTSRLAPPALGAWARDPLATGRPIRTARLAANLGLAPETTRRHLVTLEAAGFCRRDAQGWRAMAPLEARPAVAQVIETNFANVQRLFARLRQLDALAAWDAYEAQPAGSLASR